MLYKLIKQNIKKYFYLLIYINKILTNNLLNSFLINTENKNMDPNPNNKGMKANTQNKTKYQQIPANNNHYISSAVMPKKPGKSNGNNKVKTPGTGGSVGSSSSGWSSLN